MEWNEKGITLIELIASLAITSVVSVIVWSVFIQGNKYSQTAVSKNSILQEINILTSNLNNQHKTLKKYQISSNTCSIKITDQSTATPKDIIFDSSKVCFTILQINGTNGSGPFPIEPNKVGNNVSLKIKASDKKNSANSITANTYLYRMKGADYQK